MTLRFILGPAGSGKTHTCIVEMADLIAAEPLGHPLLLLVPQQSTFIYEKRLAAPLRINSAGRRWQRSCGCAPS